MKEPGQSDDESRTTKTPKEDDEDRMRDRGRAVGQSNLDGSFKGFRDPKNMSIGPAIVVGCLIGWTVSRNGRVVFR